MIISLFYCNFEKNKSTLNMNIKRILSTLLLLLSVLSFSSCIGDKGNVLESYDIGTIIDNNGQPIIKTDNIYISLTGSSLELPTADEIKRCLFTFTLDWDNQPEGAYESGIYSADISIQESWNALLTETIANKPFAESDSINNISEPYLTTIGDNTIITFESSYEVADETSVQLITGNINETEKIITLDYIYYTGYTPNITTTKRGWQSYILPKLDENYTLIFRFKSLTTPSFKIENYKSPDGDKNKNCYLYTLQYKSVNK